MNTTTKHVFSSTSCARAGGLTACDEGTGIEEGGELATPPFVSVYVYDNNNDPVENASVELYLQGTGCVDTGNTDSSGEWYSIQGAGGTYTAFAQKSMQCGSDSGYKQTYGTLELEIQLELN